MRTSSRHPPSEGLRLRIVVHGRLLRSTATELPERGQAEVFEIGCAQQPNSPSAAEVFEIGCPQQPNSPSAAKLFEIGCAWAAPP